MGYWIAVVDDEPLSLTHAKNLLSSHGMRVSCLRSGHDLIKFMKKNTPDLILLDILMPEMDGFETYKALRQLEDEEERVHIPVIFLTGEKNSETERKGLKAGASDYICKPFDKDILVKRINNTISYNKMIESLTEEATIDKLTGFLNKAAGTDKVTHLSRYRAGALMILDLDNFKLVNDLYGHDMGDRVLVAFSAIIKHNIRGEDVVCRIGGDEFMVFFIDMTQRDAIASLSGRLNDQFMKETEVLLGHDHGLPLGISIGVALAPMHSNDYQMLFQYADSSLYKVKLNGKHGFDLYNPLVDDEENRDDLAHDLARIIQIVEERGDSKGALLVGQDAFSWNYRFILRFLERYDGGAARVLFSLSAKEKGVIFSEMVAEFGTLLKFMLRKSDLVYQCKHNQYFVLLPMISESDTQELIKRIIDSWEKTGYHNKARIEYKTIMTDGGPKTEDR